jgi:hypothetical protein
MPSILIIGTMDFLTNETQINSATAIITSLNKEESKKVYDYLVSVGAQKQLMRL